MNFPRIVAVGLMALYTSQCASQVKPVAFPGAEGFGKFTTGGRGGKVVYVTNLDDDGPGSLRHAVRMKEPRIVVFAVSGYIELQSALDINHGDITIAGQSAPGDGICLKNHPLTVKADNVIIRFMRFRLGDESKQQSDAISGNKGVTNVIVDHCSMSWATDECASFYRNRNFTLQWCIISESLNASVHAKGDHGYGGIWGGEGATFHHNLIASHTSRTPRFSGSSSTRNSPDELVDFSNNVIYNWKNNNVYGGESGRYNIRANYYKPGPASTKRDRILNPWPPFGKYFAEGNVLEGNSEVTRENTMGFEAKETIPAETFIAKPFEVESVELDKAEVAYERVLRHAGASLSRDAVDARVVTEVKNNSASSGRKNDGIIDSQSDVGGWPELKGGSPVVDKDRDGMPDSWENKQGLNPADPSDASQQTLQPGYDNIETYLNSLVESVVGKI